MKVHISYKFKYGPWGGANQFLKALKKFFVSRGVYTRRPQNADAILFNSHHNLEQVRIFQEYYPEKTFIHRVDGPISIVRGEDTGVDKMIFGANQNLAQATIFQTNWSRREAYKLGMPKKEFEAVILNAPDPNIFNNKNKAPWFQGGKIKLIASSWSSNPRKGFGIYKFLDAYLDFDRFDMTFVGNAPVSFGNIKQLKPIRPKKLARILKEHDIFITASENDPCSNSLIEAMHCDLPAIAIDSGGHPEIIRGGGKIFEGKGDILSVIDNVTENYDQYQARIALPDIKEIGEKYLNFIKSIVYERKP